MTARVKRPGAYNWPFSVLTEAPVRSFKSARGDRASSEMRSRREQRDGQRLGTNRRRHSSQRSRERPHRAS